MTEHHQTLSRPGSPKFAVLAAALFACAGCAGPKMTTPSVPTQSSPQPPASPTSQALYTSTPRTTPSATASNSLPESTATPNSDSQFSFPGSIEIVLTEVAGRGDWSTVDDRFAILGCAENSPSYQLTLHDPPSFESQVLYSKEIDCDPLVSHDFSWSPDGKLIVFNGPYEGLQSISDYSQSWVTDLDTAGAFEVADQLGRFVTYLGWMDSTTLITSSYSGGGNSLVRFRDIANSVETGSSYIYGPIYTPNDSYLPVAIDRGFGALHLVALSRFAQGDLFTPFAGATTQFPLYSTTISSEFMDWRARTQFMLVRIVTFDAEDRAPQASTLVFWEVDTGDMPLSVPNAVYGRVSPDGRWFAYMQAPPNSSESQFGDCEPGETELNIMDLWVQQVKATLLVDFSCDFFSSTSLPFEPLFAFSPDGSKLAYIHTSHGDDGPAGAKSVYVIGMPDPVPITTFDADELSWSPSGRFAIVKLTGNEYVLHDLSTGESATFIPEIGQSSFQFEWAPSETYVAVLRRAPSGSQYSTVVANPLLN